MQLSLEQRLPGRCDAVIDALLDPSFLDAVGALPNLAPPVVLDLWRSDDGTVVDHRVRHRFTGSLSSAVTRVVDPAKLTWVEETTYDVPGRRATFRIVPDHYGSKLHCAGTHTFVESSSDGTTTRRVDGDLTVRVPIVGRRVESAILSGLRDHFDAEGALLRDWLSRA